MTPKYFQNRISDIQAFPGTSYTLLVPDLVQGGQGAVLVGFDQEVAALDGCSKVGPIRFDTEVLTVVL